MRADIPDLLVLRDRYRHDVASESAAADIAAGQPNPRNVGIRFGRPLMFERLRARLSRWIAPAHASRPRSMRMYESARASRLAGAEGTNSSADQELVTSLRSLRSRARQLVRDASYAKSGKRIVQSNVIGTGVGLQSRVLTTRGEPNKPVNAAIESAWKEWCKADQCHTGGGVHFSDMERMLIGQVFEAGEIFIRLHYQPFGASRIPLSLEVIEAERIADELGGTGMLAPGNMVRLGVEVDRFYRPVAYYVRERHQGEFRLGIARSDMIERVPAEQMCHLRIVERWPQTRGEPWLHTVIRKLQDIDGYSEAEIVAARASANYFASIKPADPDTPLAEKTTDGTGTKEFPLEPGMVKILAAGEELAFHAPNRPNSAMDPFMRLMLREVAAGIGTSYESLSRDYSQSNYSSSRLALLDDRDLWRFVQLWYVRNFREWLHPIWLQQAVLAGVTPNVPVEAYAGDIERYSAVRYKPRGWTWIDPTKEVEAFAKAVRNGFTTVTDVIAKTGDGSDIDDVLAGRREELDDMAEQELVFDTDPSRTSDGRPIDSFIRGGTPGDAGEAAGKPENAQDNVTADTPAGGGRELRRVV
jgi:lambda family phage portal protein